MKYLCIDLGMGTELAERIAEDGNEVYYYVPWESSTPKFTDYIIGEGFLIKKVKDWGEVLDKVDVVVFFDICFGSLAELLRKQGYLVFGGGYGERLEVDRVYGGKVLDSLGIKRPEAKVCVGVTEALTYVKDNPGHYFVKINLFRGDMETYEIKNIEELIIMFKNLESHWGPYSENITFVIEKAVEDGIKDGIDLFFNGNDYLLPKYHGCEIGIDAIGRWLERTHWDSVLERLSGFLRNIGYRGAISLEAIFNGKEFFVIDFTPRMPFSDSMVYCEFVDNLPEVIYGVAAGQNIKIKNTVPYCGEYNILTTESRDKWLYIDYDEETLVRFRRCVMKNEKVYSVPRADDSVVATVLAGGQNYQEVISRLKESIDKVRVYYGTGNYKFFDEFVNIYVKKFKEFGIDF